jgi:signal transduction histidine kinase
MAQNKKEGMFGRGGVFIRENPQILYTFFLLVAIPLAFFFTSDQFLSVAQENQDRLERSRVALLQDIVSAFAVDYADAPSVLESRIARIVEQNQPIILFLVLEQKEKGVFNVVAQSGSERFDVFLPDDSEAFLIGQSLSRPDETHLMERFVEGERYWDATRSISSGTSSRYLYTRVSMANVDAIAKRNITNAYFVLFVIIALVFLLLLRQAKIIDYMALYRKLKEVDAMKDDFVSMAAHELRSPLGIIRGYVEFLREEKLTEQGKEHLDHIEQFAGQLNLMVADILDVAKLQEGRMSFELITLDPSTLVHDVVDSFKKGAMDKSLALTVSLEKLGSITVDKDRLRQVLINLVGNAVKYTPSGSVAVTGKTIGAKVEIRVSDTGMGISSEEREKLFQKFYRVKNEETKLITGTGLGLWITHEIVSQMKGTITVESIKGKGTDFILQFGVV